MTLKFEKTWSEVARETIAAVLKKYTDDGGDLIYLTEDDRKSIKRSIDAAYPFGFRHCYPYKAWLKERRRVFIALGIPIASRRRKQEATAQLSLFSTATKRRK
jgi:hypothetical protein